MLAWCKKKGVRLEEPSNLSRAYLQKADETLTSMHAVIQFLHTTEPSNPSVPIVKAFIGAYAERVLELTPELP